MTEATNLDAAGSAILPETGDAQERPDARGPGNNYLILASGYGNTITIEDEEPQESSAFVPDADGSEATVIVPEVSLDIQFGYPWDSRPGAAGSGLLPTPSPRRPTLPSPRRHLDLLRHYCLCAVGSRMEEQPRSGSCRGAARSRQPGGRRGGTHLVTQCALYCGGTALAQATRGRAQAPGPGRV